MFEPYASSDLHVPHPQPDNTAFWRQPDHVQGHSPGQPLGGPGEPERPWDPAEELAILLQESAAPRRPEPFGHPGFDPAADTVSAMGLVAGLKHTPLERPPRQTSSGHRRSSSKSPVVTLLRTGSLFTAVLVAVIAAVVSILSGLAICDTLRHSAGLHTAHEVVSWWPLLIYGPWMVASLSILRSALHQRRALHSWSIVLLFSTLATLLCVAQAPRTIAAGTSSALPAVAALACFQQLVRQITLTRPPRHSVPRHRNRPASVLGETTVGHSPDGVPPGYSIAEKRAVRSASSGHRVRYGA
ncbi:MULTISPECIES: hypothetical protein [Streptomyces]|uniref:hypothetical protein n=1 Tax=Streptomyces TaxID=1883 RepID=UPI0004C99458|nr:hypothetical protein [Streptomyces sp. NRRL S-237]